MLPDARKIISLFFLLACFTTAAYGQDQRDGAFWQDSMQDLSIVMYGGIGGMILGLSTLSFAKRPAKKTYNIVIGGAIGVAAGVAVVIYNQAMKSRTVLPQAGPDNTPSAYFKSWEREQWHAAEAPVMQGPILVAHQISF